MIAYFNPRSREGSDSGFVLLSDKLVVYFNPRSREGSDETADKERNHHPNFNPRSREGSDTF